MNITDIKKELYKSKVNAKFSHYVSGNLYYTVQLESGKYQFPIATVEEDWNWVDMGDGPEEVASLVLSSDLGTTAFSAEIKGSELNRWISEAVETGEFIKVG